MATHRYPVTVDLGDMADAAEARVGLGDYASLSDVVRAGLAALDREDRAITAQFDQDAMRRLVQEALDDPRPPIPMAEVFIRLRARHEARLARDL